MSVVVEEDRTLFCDELNLNFTPIYKEIPFSSYARNVSGYGKKLPTTYMIKYNKRMYRVYACCWSNAGTLYFVVKGKTLYLS